MHGENLKVATIRFVVSVCLSVLAAGTGRIFMKFYI